LRQALERHDNAETDYQYTKVTFETIMAVGGSSFLPPWLVHSLEVSNDPVHVACTQINRAGQEHHPEYLIRTCLRYEAFQLALEHTLSLIRKVGPQTLLFRNFSSLIMRPDGQAGSQVSRDPPKHAFSTWLPYTLIDEVLLATTTQNGLSSRSQALRQELQTDIANRVKRMQKLSQFSR
jgi:hypothetical protein